MKRLYAVLVLFCFLSDLWALLPQPMESVTKYNVVLVHGAADSSSGFIERCASSVDDAFALLSERLAADPDSGNVPWNLGGATGMFGAYHDRSEEKMDKLTNWLDSAVFEDYGYKNGKPYIGKNVSLLFASPVIYIQRSFANPAESPAHNALEIGDRTWKGTKGCSSRRSLFEEAQEIRAHGQDSLQDRRTDTLKYSYRSIPSRNILIAHSMGGVASREYVQGNFYNGDVDKIITLDSPHEGTGALNMQIKNEARGDLIYDQMASTLATAFTTMELTAVPLLLSFKATNPVRRLPQGCSRLFCLLAR